eukprot:INCI15118.1.p1 GENE.INCI15118.1~~INCI15118.1.p1  ORF type:complete len:1048 (-),score=154.30 INCI15118.1:213-3356(-)
MGGPSGEGPYKFQAVIGQGAFAKVYRATKAGTDDVFAAKVTFLSRVPAGFLPRIKEEARLLSQIKHPHIIPFFSFTLGPKKQRAVLVMGLAEGGSIEKFTTGQDKLREPQIVQVLHCVAKALAFLHKRHITHCDLKPDNILVMKPGDFSTIRVADFGISQQSKLRLKVPCGTARYCAPEIFRDPCRFGPPVDVWSLGIIVVQFVMGKHPFAELQGKDFNDIYDNPRLTARLETYALDPKSHPMAQACSAALFTAAQSMLQVNTAKRVTAKALLKAPVFSSHSRSTAVHGASAAVEANAASSPSVRLNSTKNSSKSMREAQHAEVSGVCKKKPPSHRGTVLNRQASTRGNEAVLQTTTITNVSSAQTANAPAEEHNDCSRVHKSIDEHSPGASGSSPRSPPSPSKLQFAHRSGSVPVDDARREQKMASQVKRHHSENKLGKSSSNRSRGRSPREHKLGGTPVETTSTSRSPVASNMLDEGCQKPVAASLDDQLAPTGPISPTSHHARSLSDHPKRTDPTTVLAQPKERVVELGREASLELGPAPVQATSTPCDSSATTRRRSSHARSVSESPAFSDGDSVLCLSLPSVHDGIKKTASTAPPVLEGGSTRGSVGSQVLRNPTPGLDLLQQAMKTSSPPRTENHGLGIGSRHGAAAGGDSSDVPNLQSYQSIWKVPRATYSGSDTVCQDRNGSAHGPASASQHRQQNRDHQAEKSTNRRSGQHHKPRHHKDTHRHGKLKHREHRKTPLRDLSQAPPKQSEELYVRPPSGVTNDTASARSPRSKVGSIAQASSGDQSRLSSSRLSPLQKKLQQIPSFRLSTETALTSSAASSKHTPSSMRVRRRSTSVTPGKAKSSGSQEYSQSDAIAHASVVLQQQGSVGSDGTGSESEQLDRAKLKALRHERWTRRARRRALLQKLDSSGGPPTDSSGDCHDHAGDKILAKFASAAASSSPRRQPSRNSSPKGGLSLGPVRRRSAAGRSQQLAVADESHHAVAGSHVTVVRERRESVALEKARQHALKKKLRRRKSLQGKLQRKASHAEVTDKSEDTLL